MEINKQIIEGEGFKVPSIVITPDKFEGVIVIAPGYGGSKEELLGLAYRVAEVGFKVLTIDFRGHGENTLDFDEKIKLDVEAVIKYCRSFGKGITAIGHSLGGRIALTSRADYSIGISPALNKEFSEETIRILRNMRDYRVIEKSNGIIIEVLKKISSLSSKDDSQKAIIYGTRDVPEIKHICESYKTGAENLSIIEIKNALHSDIITLEETFQNVIMMLKNFYSKDKNNEQK